MKLIKTIKLLLLIAPMLLFGFLTPSVSAFDWGTNSGLGQTGGEAGYAESGLGEKDLLQTVAFIINTVLSFLGVLFFILTIYAGFLWMFSRGNESEVEKAKKILINAVIGLIVILLAYAITAFITNLIQVSNQ